MAPRLNCHSNLIQIYISINKRATEIAITPDFNNSALTLGPTFSTLRKLKLLPNDLNKVIENKLYQEFFMHKTGHWLGLDVHDVGEYENVTFVPGMVITVEPGIYINSSNKNVPKKWRGIGIRIEDDVLVTKKGNQVLTKKLPKKKDEIELLCNQKT